MLAPCLSTHCRTHHSLHPGCRRKSPYTPRYNAAAPKPTKKKGSYWDNIDWDAPLRSFVPDKWYIRVAWAVLILGVTLYFNFLFNGAAGAAAPYGRVLAADTGSLEGLLL